MSPLLLRTTDIRLDSRGGLSLWLAEARDRVRSEPLGLVHTRCALDVSANSRLVTQAQARAGPAVHNSRRLLAGPGKTHVSIALGIRACLAGRRVLFRTATEWVALLADTQRSGRQDEELSRLRRIPLLIVDEVGYIPVDPQAAILMFMLVSRRYET